MLRSMMRLLAAVFLAFGLAAPALAQSTGAGAAPPDKGGTGTARIRYDCALVGRKILNDNGVQVGDMVVAGVVTGVVGMAIVAGVKEENAKTEARKAEIDCLASHGLRQQGLCACPQMSHCRGSWARMQCNELKTLCRDTPSNKVYEKNSCAKLKKLVGGF